MKLIGSAIPNDSRCEANCDAAGKQIVYHDSRDTLIELNSVVNGVIVSYNVRTAWSQLNGVDTSRVATEINRARCQINRSNANRYRRCGSAFYSEIECTNKITSTIQYLAL